jgi:hypothetical protein
MITIFTKPKELLNEFRKDRDKALYWQDKLMVKEGRNLKSKSLMNFESTFMSQDKDLRSEVFEYSSPQYNNKWMLWWRFQSRGYGCLPKMRDYQVLYYMTAKYMAIMVPTCIESENFKMKGVSVFTDHLFQRMADEDRLGVDMRDRKNVILNFVETVITGIIDIRDPRDGERDKQAICRLPKSWLKGHIKELDGSYIMRFNTFIPDKSMSYKQRNYLKSFAKFADAFTSEDEIKDYFSQKEDSTFNN